MAITDNREFIAALEKTRDLVRIKEEVDWDQELGAMVRKSNELRGPALLFESIKNYSGGYRVLGSPLASTRRLAVLLGLDPKTSYRELQETYEKRTDNPVKPRIVKSGPCKENIVKGDKVDLFDFPIPLIHTGDGGRYIGTWHAVATRDPDSGWNNYGMYRMMAYNKKHAGVYLHTGNHGGQLFFRKYKPLNKPMPCSIAIGADPATAMMASCYIRRNLDETEFAGALIGEPINLVKCETNDLLVPAASEIVLEGVILPDIMIQEGPFGEFPGYRTQVGFRPVLQVNLIAFRNNPILTMTNMGMPMDDSDITMAISSAVMIKRRLTERNMKVTNVYMPPEGCTHLIVIGIKPDRPNLVQEIGNLVFTQGIGETKVVIVEDDVDIFNMEEVIHAIATKCHPGRGVTVMNLPFCVPLTPYLSPKEREENKGYRLLLDCTWPMEWSKETDIPPRMYFNEEYTDEIKQKANAKLKKYGL